MSWAYINMYRSYYEPCATKWVSRTFIFEKSHPNMVINTEKIGGAQTSTFPDCSAANHCSCRLICSNLQWNLPSSSSSLLKHEFLCVSRRSRSPAPVWGKSGWCDLPFFLSPLNFGLSHRRITFPKRPVPMKMLRRFHRVTVFTKPNMDLRC